MSNLDLWNRVCRTDPKHTKHVNQRGGFTAIDAMYQIENATREFGPVGVGWGWDFELIFPQNNTVIAIVTLWHGKRDQTVKQVGQKLLGAQRPDEDAVKKAVTDGLTKCLSYLGFNADVFLGKFDDSKYVQEVTQEFAPKPPAVVIELTKLVESTDDVEQLKTGFNRMRDEIKKLQELPEHKSAINAAIVLYQTKLKTPQKVA